MMTEAANQTPPAAIARLLTEDQARVRETLHAAGRDLREFQEPDGRYTARYLLTVWLATAAVGAAWYVLKGAALLALVPAIGIIQHAMLNIVHEASHFALVKNRRWNERIADLAAALPIAHTVASYRLTHLDHHNYLRTPRDPASYVTRPDLTAGDIRRTLLFLLCGRLVWELAARILLGRRFEPEAAADKHALQDTDRRRLLAVALWHAPALAACYLAGMAGFWLAWMATVMTVTPTLDGIRTLVEHRARPGTYRAFHTRTHHRNIVVSGLMAPFFQYHWEHHLFPTIPHHQLAKLHRLLASRHVPGAQPGDGGFFAVLARVI